MWIPKPGPDGRVRIGLSLSLETAQRLAKCLQGEAPTSYAMRKLMKGIEDDEATYGTWKIYKPS